MKILIGILGALCMLLVLWHVFAPRDWWIEGFYGMPLFICMIISGISIGIGLDELNN